MWAYRQREAGSMEEKDRDLFANIQRLASKSSGEEQGSSRGARARSAQERSGSKAGTREPTGIAGRARQSVVAALSARANNRAYEFIEQVHERHTERSSTSCSVHHHEDEDIHTRYQQLVQGINTAMSGPVLPIMPLTPGKEAIVIKLDFMHPEKFFSVQLPPRPTMVSVTVVAIEGALPTMWGSTAEARPNSRNHDFQAVNGEMEFRHEPEPGEPGEASCFLFVGVEFEEGPATFRIRSMIRRPKQPLNSHIVQDPKNRAIPLTTARMTSNIFKRIDQLQRDSDCRQQFEDHIIKLRRGRAEQRKALQAANHAKLKAWNEAETGLSPKRRQELALQKREMLEAQELARAQWWVNRPEQARLEKEAEVARLEEESRNAERRCLWLERLVVVSCAEHIARQWQKKRRIVRELRAKVQAARVLQKFFLRTLASWRCRQLFRNVVRFRVAVVTHVRHTRHVVAATSQTKVAWFINSNVCNDRGSMPSMVTTLRRFLGRVRSVQRSFRRMRCARDARVEALMQHFLARDIFASRLQAPAPSSYPSSASAALPTSRKTRHTVHHARKTVVHAAVAPAKVDLDAPIHGQHAPHHGQHHALEKEKTSEKKKTLRLEGPIHEKKRSSRRPSIVDGSTVEDSGAPSGSPSGQPLRTPLPHEKKHTVVAPHLPHAHLGLHEHAEHGHGHANDSEEEDDDERPLLDGDEELPDWMRQYVLKEHVLMMQRTLYERLEEWRRAKKEAQVDEDLRAIGLSEDKSPKVGPRPRIIEMWRMKPLYLDTLKKWRGGEYKHLIHDRCRAVVKVFRAWHREAAHISHSSKTALQRLKDHHFEEHYGVHASEHRAMMKHHVQTAPRKRAGSMTGQIVATFGGLGF
eukprot:gnl/TRDRNA2_/TRDRNA2_38835_c0_seq1.p1 gnl/TRDRNA2_/TRDRNA2_38835_c0~~gnl/TRDRNA2_/TRDRNA2_38835_c0_seq1.p1  ORF type:complete len:886 (-),score=149.70 gnl/TRDRNA2_/TRDRNA2_38835_c0_seq1:81-2675(-)